MTDYYLTTRYIERHVYVITSGDNGAEVCTTEVPLKLTEIQTIILGYGNTFERERFACMTASNKRLFGTFLLLPVSMKKM